MSKKIKLEATDIYLRLSQCSARIRETFSNGESSRAIAFLT